MEEFIQVLNEAFLSFGLRETICFLMFTIFCKWIGINLCLAKYLPPESILGFCDDYFGNYFHIGIALFIGGLACAFILEIWCYPAVEIKIFIIIWALIWCGIGWIKHWFKYRYL